MKIFSIAAPFCLMVLVVCCSDYSVTLKVTNQTGSLHDVEIKNYATFSLDIDESVTTDIDWEYNASEPLDDTEDITVLVDGLKCADFPVADGESKHIKIYEFGSDPGCSY